MVERLEEGPSQTLRLVAELRLPTLPELPAKSPKRRINVLKERVKWGRLVRDACEKAKLPQLELDSAALTFTRHSLVAPPQEDLTESFKAIKESLVISRVLSGTGEFDEAYIWAKNPRRFGGFVTITIEVPE